MTGLNRHELLIVSVIIIGAIMSILDVTIVNVAIETISRDLHAPISQVQWISTGYMLALAAVIPLSGWLVERFGAKKVWMTSLVGFMAGSLLSGLATDIDQLIIFRILQGVFGGLVMPVGITILAITSKEKINKVMGLIGIPMLLGPVLGPVIGGVLVEYASWQWIFFVNIPIGIVAMIMAWKILPKSQGVHNDRLDWLGVLLLSPGLSLLVYGLAETAANGGLHGVKVLLPLILGTSMVLLFIIHSLRVEKPLLDLKLFTRPALRAAAATTTLLGAALFGSMILIPLYYQLVHGASALQAGLLMAPQGLGAAIFMFPGSLAAERWGPGKAVMFGLSILLIGTIPWAFVTADTSDLLLGASLFIRGVGMAFCFMPAMSAAYSVMKQHEIPKATSVLNVLQRVGGAFGTAIFTVYLTNNLTSHLKDKGIPVKPGGSAIPNTLPPSLHELFASSFAATFWIVMGVTLVAFIPAYFLYRNTSASDLTPAVEFEAEKAALSIEGANL